MWSLISGLVSLVGSVMSYFSNKQLLDAGKAEQQKADLTADNKAEENALAVANSTTDAVIDDSLRNGSF